MCFISTDTRFWFYMSLHPLLASFCEFHFAKPPYRAVSLSFTTAVWKYKKREKNKQKNPKNLVAEPNLPQGFSCYKEKKNRRKKALKKDKTSKKALKTGLSQNLKGKIAKGIRKDMPKRTRCVGGKSWICNMQKNL